MCSTGSIPLTFEFQGLSYSGYFHRVQGAGNTAVFYLNIDHYYYGRLRYTNEWVFDTNKLSKGWEILAEYFGDIVILWNDSH